MQFIWQQKKIYFPDGVQSQRVRFLCLVNVDPRTKQLGGSSFSLPWNEILNIISRGSANRRVPGRAVVYFQKWTLILPVL